MSGLPNTITRMLTGTYDVTRAVVGTLTKGVYAPGAATVVPIDASIQPVDGVALKDLPEAQYGAETIVIYTNVELVTRGMESEESDQILYKGKRYRVTRVQHFDVRSGHYRAYAVKVDVP